MKVVHYNTRLMTDRDALQVLGLSAVCGGSVRSVADVECWCHTIGSVGIVVEVEGDITGYCLLDLDKSGLLIRDMRAIGADLHSYAKHATLALFAHVIDAAGKRRLVHGFINDGDTIGGTYLRWGGMKAISYSRKAGLWLYEMRIGGAE